MDSAQLVLPNTSPNGKDAIRQELHALQEDWDAILTLINDGKTQLDTCVGQWEVYDDSVAQVVKWLSEMENSIKDEAMLQPTLAEKRTQLERVKVSRGEMIHRDTGASVQMAYDAVQDTTTENTIRYDTK